MASNSYTDWGRGDFFSTGFADANAPTLRSPSGGSGDSSRTRCAEGRFDYQPRDSLSGRTSEVPRIAPRLQSRYELPVGSFFLRVFSPVTGWLVFGSTLVLAQDSWPQFRGAESRGIGASDQLPLVWSAETNVAWKTPIPGRGWASPIVWGNHVFVTTAVSDGEEETPRKGLYFGGERPASAHRHRWLVLDLDRTTGAIRWTSELAAAVPSSSIHVKNTHASETPVTDGKHLYALFGSVGVYCLDFHGKVIWSQPLPARKTVYGWGTAASPVLHGDRLYVVSDNQEHSSLAAYDKNTGRELWRVDRDEPTNFATPFVWRNAVRTELVISGRNKVRSYDLDGHELWTLRGMSTIAIPTPFESGGLLYLAAGYVGDTLKPNKPVYAVRPGAAGDLTLAEGETRSASIVWMQPNASSYNPSPLIYRDRFYVLWDFGFFNCRNAATGDELYPKQRLRTEGTAGFTASPWAYRDRVFCLSEDGDTYVIPAGDTYRVERVNSLGELCMATPALSGRKLFIRTFGNLYCIEDGAQPKAGSRH